MTEALSSEEGTRRWEFLIGIENLKPTKTITSSYKSPSLCVRGKAGGMKRTLSTFLSPYSSKKAMHSRMSDPASDPYDCSSMTVLPTHDIVENAVHQYLEEWKKLDDRKIYQKSTTSKFPPVERDKQKTKPATTITGSADTKASINTNHGGGWRAMEDRLSLPDGFDFNKKNSNQQFVEKETPVHDGFQGDIVNSLKNPAQKLSYHSELSKLFDSIPAYRELEEQIRRGHKVDNTLRVYHETRNPTKSTPDSYALARLRVPDRHGLPQSLPTSSQCNMHSTERRKNQVFNSHSATVLLEFWRIPPKRCMSSGRHRMVVEFFAGQTLWDVHAILSHMAEDELWLAADGGKALEYDSNISLDNTLMTESFDEKEDEKLNDKDDSQQNISGCFFIENTFYKTGSVDYAKPIIDWIDGSESNHPNYIRREYLGINPSSCLKHVKTMKMTKLSQVPFRPNIRYYHACHGDVETTVMLVDRKLINQNRDRNESEDTSCPLIHDIWTAPRLPAVPLCDACQIYQSVFKTSTDCKTTDGGPHSLCQECCKDLNLLKNDQDSVKLYKIWHDQANLSNAIACDHSTTF